MTVLLFLAGGGTPFIPCPRRCSLYSFSSAVLLPFLFHGGAPSIPCPWRYSSSALAAVLLPILEAPPTSFLWLRRPLRTKPSFLLGLLLGRSYCFRASHKTLGLSASPRWFFAPNLHLVSFSIVIFVTQSMSCTLLTQLQHFHLLIAAFFQSRFHFSYDSSISRSTPSFLLRLFHFSFDSFIAASTPSLLLYYNESTNAFNTSSRIKYTRIFPPKYYPKIPRKNTTQKWP